jgi:TatA/E family protein of Tat protein translocase
VIENLFRPTHLLMIFIVYMLCFGAEKLPTAGKSIAEAIKEFRKGMREQ